MLRGGLYDVAVVGGGMVGGAVASGLARHRLTSGLRIALIEREPPRSARRAAATARYGPPALRVSAISRASAAALERAGAWERVLAARATPYSEMQVWDWLQTGRIHWRASELDVENLGYVVENDVILEALDEALQESRDGAAPGLEIESGVGLDALRLPSLQDGGGPAVLQLSSGQEIGARLVVGADGPTSSVRSLASMGAWGWDYKQRAVVASLKTASPHRTAWQRFLPTGPIALLPCHDDWSSLVWSTTPEHARRLVDGSVPASEFIGFVNAAFRLPPESFVPGGRLSWFHRPLPDSLESLMPVLFPPPPDPLPPLVTDMADRPRDFPLRLIHTGAYSRSRVALVGDAAHAIHPLAGQGVNLGFADAAALVDAVAGAVEAGEDPGAAAIMDDYAAERRMSNAPLIAGVDTFQRLFQVKDGLVTTLRTAGILGFNATPALKREASRRSGLL